MREMNRTQVAHALELSTGRGRISIWSRRALLLGAVTALGSCDMMGSGRIVSTQDLESAVQSLESRQDAHHQVVSAANDADTVRRELTSYASDMAPIFRQMMEACDRTMKEMMGDQTVAAEDYNQHAEFMMAAIREHVAAMRAAQDVGAMKRMCEEHDARVKAMARHMRTMVEMMKMMNNHDCC